MHEIKQTKLKFPLKFASCFLIQTSCSYFSTTDCTSDSSFIWLLNWSGCNVYNSV